MNWGRDSEEEVLPLKRKSMMRMDMGKCYFRMWEAKPENKWGYHNNARNLGRVVPAISISKVLCCAGLCNVFRWACFAEL